MEIFNIITLSLSGLLLTMVGFMRLTNPIKTYSKNSGIELPNDGNLLNEIRGISALMMSGGIIILSGILLSEITIFSFAAAILVFLGFAIGRIFSMVIDGKPHKQLVTGLVSELILGSANVFCLFNAFA